MSPQPTLSARLVTTLSDLSRQARRELDAEHPQLVDELVRATVLAQLVDDALIDAEAVRKWGHADSRYQQRRRRESRQSYEQALEDRRRRRSEKGQAA